MNLKLDNTKLNTLENNKKLNFIMSSLLFDDIYDIELIKYTLSKIKENYIKKEDFLEYIENYFIDANSINKFNQLSLFNTNETKINIFASDLKNKHYIDKINLFGLLHILNRSIDDDYTKKNNEIKPILKELQFNGNKVGYSLTKKDNVKLSLCEYNYLDNLYIKARLNSEVLSTSTVNLLEKMKEKNNILMSNISDIDINKVNFIYDNNKTTRISIEKVNLSYMDVDSLTSLHFKLILNLFNTNNIADVKKNKEFIINNKDILKKMINVDNITYFLNKAYTLSSFDARFREKNEVLKNEYDFFKELIIGLEIKDNPVLFKSVCDFILINNDIFLIKKLKDNNLFDLSICDINNEKIINILSKKLSNFESDIHFNLNKSKISYISEQIPLFENGIKNSETKYLLANFCQLFDDDVLVSLLEKNKNFINKEDFDFFYDKKSTFLTTSLRYGKMKSFEWAINFGADPFIKNEKNLSLFDLIKNTKKYNHIFIMLESKLLQNKIKNYDKEILTKIKQKV